MASARIEMLINSFGAAMRDYVKGLADGRDAMVARAALVAAIEAEVEAAWERGRDGGGVEP